MTATDPLLDLIGPRARRRRWRWLGVGAAIGLIAALAVIGSMVALISVLGPDPATGVSMMSMVPMALSLVLISASISSFAAVWKLTLLATSPGDLGRESQRRILRAVYRGRSELTPVETAAASRIAAAASEYIPWQFLHTALLLIGITCVQLAVGGISGVFAPFAVGFAVVIAALLVVLGMLTRTRVEHIRAFASAHPYPPASAPLPSGPDQS